VNFPGYPRYKDSGVEWLGEVPEHWDVCAVKRVAELRSGDSISADRIGEVGDYPVLGGNGLRGFTSEFTHDGHFALIGRQGALCGNINYGIGRFWASEHAVVASPVKPVNTVWLGELLRAMNLNQYSISAAQPGLSVDTLGSLQIVCPPEREQAAIAAFLLGETAKIDALVSEQHRLIELLNEKRQAAISHTVTKGLSPGTPVKPSGVEWLGDVPAHWETVRLKHVKSSDPNAFVDGPFGSNLKSEHFIDGGDVYVIESGFATQGVLDTSQLKTISGEHFQTIRRSETKGGDIIIAKIGAQFGKSAILPRLDRCAVVSGNSLKLTVNEQRCDVRFVNWWLSTLKQVGAIDAIVNGSAQPALSLGDMNELPVLLPPVGEQRTIVSAVEGWVARFNSLIAEANRAIALLQERRTALISAAVTGKIDVRCYEEAEAAAA
jgi:type I restriction enzyme, S subunit